MGASDPGLLAEGQPYGLAELNWTGTTAPVPRPTEGPVWQAAYTGAAKRPLCSRLVRRFVALDVQMLDRERSIMRGHFLVVMLRDRIGSALGAALEHFRLFLQNLGLGHGCCSLGQIRQAT
jgi:hypothetical protein